MDKSNFLIDFNSPVQKLDPKPLIPVPPESLLPLAKTNDLSDDPFEVAEIVCPDPFESVSKLAFNNSKMEHTQEVQPPNSSEEKNQNHLKSEDIESQKSLKMDCSDETSDISLLPVRHNLLNEVPVELDKEYYKNGIPVDSEDNLQNTSNITVDNATTLAVQDSNSQSQITTDFSTEESLKAVIAKRVNRCIQEVLNGSININKNEEKTVFKKTQNKRSRSFIGLPTMADKQENKKMNRSCSEFNDSFNLQNQELHGPNSSSDSLEFSLLSPSTTDVSAEENIEEQVFREARRLSRTFSKLADSFRLEQVPSDSDDDDIMSCKPRWLYTESSEDEEEKLLKDPALNFRRRSDASIPNSPAPAAHKNPGDSPALLAYKTRRSFTQLQLHTSQEVLNLKRSISVGSQLKEEPVISIIAPIVPINLMKSDDQPMKLKKHNSKDVKKGPMRAVMPIQSMTKEPVPNPAKPLSKKVISPEMRLQRPVNVVGTPNKDNSHFGLTPVASSTPNKAESFLSSGKTGMLKPVIQVPPNKRHSLESNVGNHKSRGDVPEVGGRPRSSSVNSSIPRVMGMAVKGGQLIPKSTSSLPRSAYSQINSHNVKNVPEKKNTSKMKSNINSRVLADVKTKSPLHNKVRAAVNTISSLVTSRGKKTASRDKENRVPV